MSKKEYVRLSDDWLTEGLIDLEYKKYHLLAYLQKVEARFTDRELYPPFADIIFHYKNLLKFQESNNALINNFPKDLSKIDLEKLVFHYRRKLQDPLFMEDINKIIDFALPMFINKIQKGKELYDEIENNINIEPIGVCPINQSEGYLLVNRGNDKYVHIFEYQVTLFDSAESRFRGIYTNYLEKVKKGITNTFESIKMSLIKKHKKLPNPATFVVDTVMDTPLNETLLPISKRLLVQKLVL